MSASEINVQTSTEKTRATLRRFFHWLSSPRVILSLIMLVIMFYMVIIPLYTMVKTTITYQEKDVFRVPDAQVGKLTLFHYIRMFNSEMSKPYLRDPLVHSMTISFGATGLAFVIGGLLAWMCIRTDMPGRKLINQLALLPYIMPGWTIAQAWTVLFKNRITGGTSGVFEYLIGQSPPTWLAYGPVPIIISSALHYYTFFFLFVTAALMSIDSSLEEAGDLMGASRGRILRKITFPLVLPALLSGFIMTFSKVMGTYGGPALLGVPVKYYTVSTMIRSAIGIGDKADGFVLAITLIMFAIVNIYINQRLVGTRRSYETIGGRGFMAKPTKLRNWKSILTTVVIVFQVMVIVIPLSLLLFDTFMLTSGVYSLDNFTLHNWIGQSVKTINNGSPGVLRNLYLRLELNPIITLDILIHGSVGNNSWLFHCERKGYPLVQAGRTAGFHPLCYSWYCFWRCLYLDVCQAYGSDPPLIWDICAVGRCIYCQTYPLFFPFGGISNASSGTGVGRGC
jgi:iron(III) transport system permease protein